MFVVIDDEQLLNAMFLQNCLGLFERGADGNRDERLLGHHFRDRNVETRFKTQIAISDDADEMTVFVHNRHAADVKTLHHLERFAHRTIGTDRNRIDDHSRFRAFYFIDFFGLPFDGQVLVNDADAALLRERDCQGCFSHGVHRRRAERNL